MKHGTLVLPIDRARYFVDLIGANAKMQFEDMNARDLHRPYKKYIQRIDEMERIIRFLMEELTKVPHAEVIRNNVDSFLAKADEYKLDDVEARLKQIYQDFIQFKENNVKLTGKKNAALEERYVVQTAIASMAQMSQTQRASPLREDGDQFEFAASRSLLHDEEGGARRTLETMFSNIAGVIPQAEQDRFARTLWRATRGNTFTHFQQIFEPMQDPKTGREVHKSVFVIYFQDTSGSSASAMSEKITKICSSFGVNTYRWPTSRQAAEEMLLNLQVQVEDQERLLKAHENFVRSEAATLLEPARPGGDSLVEEWRMFCVKEKSIYATLNLFEGHMNLRANCWYPEAEEDEIRRMLIHQSTGHGNSSAMLVSDRADAPRKSPPTYIRRNEFTAPFQDMIDTIGLPRYQEANAALFTVVTFPVLFGVMFGDVGHGAMVLCVGIFCIWKADEIKFSVPNLYYGRYLFFMMGFFAVYMGLLYNDLFSIGLTLFNSHWEAPDVPSDSREVRVYQPKFDVKNQGGPGPYPFGIDPAWHGAQNQLVFTNSLKMKLSVILGVVQMIVGLLLRFSNAIHFRNWVDFFCECVPMMVFMLCFFGFMDVMILYKWVTPMDNPPGIINAMISMALWTPDSNPMLGENLPRILMVTSVLTVPILLIPKPLFIRSQHKAEIARQLAQRRGRMPIGDEELAHECSVDSEEDTFDMQEVVVHQVIETIEYVLGSVSHTASYLRLWALSLAHQQLSAVFFDMMLKGAMNVVFPLNVITIYIGFSMWFGCSVGILVVVDSLECFLHTMRLHWIEFQSKFYKGDGYAFVPFRHRDILAMSTEE